MKTTTRKTEVRPIQIDLICECGSVMLKTGRSRNMSPPTHHHMCSSCDRVSWELRQYPYVTHEPLYVPKEPA